MIRQTHQSAEIQALGKGLLTSSSREVILFSVQDLFGYLKAHATMSGIQRVQAGIALYAIAHENRSVGFILNDLSESYRDGEFLLIDNLAFRAIILYASGKVVDHDQLRAMLHRAEEEAVVIRPGADNVIILLGAFWGHGNTMDRYVAAKRDGAKIGAYIYDIIPITHPEYCDEALSRDFSMSIGELNLVVDFAFTISDYTRETLDVLLKESGGRQIPMRTVPLAHSMTVHDDAKSAWPASLQRIKGLPYVAYVSTVEGRKNHLYVVSAWRQMIEQGIDVPDLVFVGRKGWRVNGLIDLLDGTHDLDGRVHIIHNLSDAELNCVYANCLFTVFTSFVEGWGLPVGESLVHHVPCVASATSSVPEVGGDLVDYVDPFNLREGVTVLRRMIEDHFYRDERRKLIKNTFKPRTWDDVGRDFIAKTHEALKYDFPHRQLHPFLPAGQSIALSDLAIGQVRIDEYVRSPIRMALAGNFYRVEDWGAWMRGATGKITIRTDLAEGCGILVCCRVRPSPTAIGDSVEIRLLKGPDQDQSTGQAEIILAEGENLLCVTGRTGRDGICTILLDFPAEIKPIAGDGRCFAIGVTAIGYTDSEKVANREDLIERSIFHDLTPRARPRPSGAASRITREAG